MPKIVAKSIQTCFEHVLGKIFRKKFAQFSMEGRVFEIFQKNQKICKIPKMPKIVPKSIQTCFELVLGQIFRIFFLPSVPWRVEFSKIFRNFFFKIPKMPKIVPKSIQTCFELVLCEIFRKIFLPSVPWRVEFSKIFKKYIFKIPRMPKSVPKRIQTCFRVIFSKKFNAQCSMEGRVFENFQKKIRKVSKFQKCPKLLPKVSKRVLNMFWGKFFEKFSPSFPWKVESSKVFKKIKKFAKFQKCPKSFPKVSKRVLNLF